LDKAILSFDCKLSLLGTISYGRVRLSVPAEEGLRNAPQKTGIPAVFIDIGREPARITESLKTDGRMSIAHKADGDESEAFRGAEIFECVFYLHDCGTRAAIKRFPFHRPGALCPFASRARNVSAAEIFHYARDARGRMEISKVKSFLVLVGAA